VHNNVCQDGAVLRARTLAGLIVVCLAGCAAPDQDAAPPQFVAPTPIVPSASSEPPAAPSTTPTPSTSRAPSQKAATTAPKTTSKVKYVFPVRAGNVAFHPTHAKYPATDIFADCGEAVVATTSGLILEVSRTDRYVEGSPDGPNNGGLSVSLLGDDGVRYYGSHLSKLQSGVRAGVRVTAGQRLGSVGRTGNANNVCHLHFGISPPCARTGDWKVRRGVVWPASYLTSWRKRGNASPVAKAKSWERSHNCRA
jgi:murein DD-endopeptidase MepM/ murein hydrolase activator NlpD